MACREVADSSSGSGFPMNDDEATAPSNSPARATYEDKPPSRKAFDIEGANTMQRKRENYSGREIPGARMNKMTRIGLPSPKKVPGYLAVGGPAFPGTSRASAEKDKEIERIPLLAMLGIQYNTPKTTTTSTDIWGALEIYEQLQMKRNREEHIARCMMNSNWKDLASDDLADDAAGVVRFALGAEASRRETPERSHGGVSVEEFKKYLISSAKSHASSSGEKFSVRHNASDETLRDPWGFSCRDNMYMYRRVPSQPQASHPRGAALFNPWGSLHQETMFRRLPRPATPPQASVLRSAPRNTTSQPPSDPWAPSNLDIKYVSTVPLVTPPLGADDARRRVVGYRPPAAGEPEARAVEPEVGLNQVASKKPVLLTPDDFLTLSNTDISSMLEKVNSDKSDTASVKPYDGSYKTEGEVSDGSEEGSLTVSDHGKDTESDREGSDEDEEYIHPMQVISDSIDKVDSWLQKNSDVLSSGVHAAARVVDDAPLYDMPADDEVVERCQDIKRREFESTLDLARRKLRANSIKFERVAARFEKLYNEHLLEKCWLAELEAMKGRMSVKPPALNKTKRNEAPAPADTNASGPSGVARK